MDTETTAKKPTRLTIRPRLPVERAVLTSLRELVRLYTRHHGDLEVDHALMSTNFTVSVRVNDDDQGKMVGGGGTNIWALKLIFKIVGLRMGKRLQLTLQPPRRGQQEPLTPFEANPDFDHVPLAEVLGRLLAMMASQPLRLTAADVAEETHFEIAPDVADLELFRGDVASAFRNLITAIGKSQGRRMNFYLADPDNLEGRPPEREPSPEADTPPQVPVHLSPPVDAIDAEARERGFDV